MVRLASLTSRIERRACARGVRDVADRPARASAGPNARAFTLSGLCLARVPRPAADAPPRPSSTQVNIPKAKKNFCKKCKKHHPTR